MYQKDLSSTFSYLKIFAHLPHSARVFLILKHNTHIPLIRALSIRFVTPYSWLNHVSTCVYPSNEEELFSNVYEVVKCSLCSSISY